MDKKDCKREMRKKAEKREPYIKFTVRFIVEINGDPASDTYNRTYRLKEQNRDKEALFHMANKGTEDIARWVEERQISTGFAGSIRVVFCKIIIEESFHNSNFKAGDEILNPEIN